MLTSEQVARGLIEVEVWAYVDSEERAWAHEDMDALKERMADDGAEPGGRLVRLAIVLPAPSCVDATVELPADNGECNVTVKA